MKEKVKCKKCGLLIDDDLETCPYCGYYQKEEETNKKPEEPIEAEIVENNSDVEKEHSSIRFLSFEDRSFKVPLWKSITFFAIGFLGLRLIAALFKIIASSSSNLYFLNNVQGSAAINFACYFLLFGLMLFVLNYDSLKLISRFKHAETYIYGLEQGFLLLLVSSTVTVIFKQFASTGSNANETGIDSITDIYPLLSLLVFGILGPICEEFTYRVGLFNLIKKLNRPLAYIGTALIFGLIHFDFTAIGTADIVTELVNLPSYIVSGLLLCYFYEYRGLETSMLAHMTNNLFAILIQILL